MVMILSGFCRTTTSGSNAITQLVRKICEPIKPWLHVKYSYSEIGLKFFSVVF